MIDVPPTKKRIDSIQKILGPWFREHDFKRKGRNYHRRLDNDIVQVVNFQTSVGAPRFVINIGSMVPEFYKILNPDKEVPESPKEYQCTVRDRIREVPGEGETWWHLGDGDDTYIAIRIQDTLDKTLEWFDGLATAKDVAQAAVDKEYAIHPGNRHIIRPLKYLELVDKPQAEKLAKEYEDNKEAYLEICRIRHEANQKKFKERMRQKLEAHKKATNNDA